MNRQLPFSFAIGTESLDKPMHNSLGFIDNYSYAPEI